MSRWFAVAWSEVLLVLGILAAIVGPTSPWLNVYCPVQADVESWSAADCVRTETWLGAPNHLVKEGQLLLRVQSTRGAIVLVTYVDAPRWDELAVADYRAEHPELDALWLDRSRVDGGIRWLRR